MRTNRATKNSPFYMAVVHISVIPGGTEGLGELGNSLTL